MIWVAPIPRKGPCRRRGGLETVFLFVRMSCRGLLPQKTGKSKKIITSDGFDGFDKMFLQFSMVFGEGVQGGGRAGVAPGGGVGPMSNDTRDPLKRQFPAR